MYLERPQMMRVSRLARAGSQTATADDIEDEYETVRRQRLAKHARIASQ